MEDRAGLLSTLKGGFNEKSATNGELSIATFDTSIVVHYPQNQLLASGASREIKKQANVTIWGLLKWGYPGYPKMDGLYGKPY